MKKNKAKIEQLKQEVPSWSLDELMAFSSEAYNLDYELGTQVAAEIRLKLHEAKLYGTKLVYH